MQGGRGGGNGFFGFGDPLAGFGALGRPGSLISSFFGGRNPFDDPLFTQPFGGMLGPSMSGSSMFGPSMLGSSMLGSSMFGAGGSIFEDPNRGGFLEQPSQPKSKGPIIQELSSDDEGGQGEESGGKNHNPRKRSRTDKEPYVEDPEEEVEVKRSRNINNRGEFSRTRTVAARPQSRSFSFQSSTVTYGGPNGAYYTSSTTRRTGGDGVSVEESKEANTTTGKASHRISRGLRDKGHSVTRKLCSDGRVDMMQTIHNLDEDELPGFVEAWEEKARQHLPGWNQGLDMFGDGNTRGSSGGQVSRGWALPSTEQVQDPRVASSSRAQTNSSKEKLREL